jgi:hypothetical protein
MTGAYPIMSNNASIKVNHELDGWQEAIAEARSQLEALELRKKGLLEVIARFEQFRKLGEPWPLKNETAGTAAESVPA